MSSHEESVIPSWINEEFFETVLKHYEKNDNIKLNRLVVTPTYIKVEHLGSMMFTCKLQYTIDSCLEIKEESFILKTLPDNKTEQSKFFENEMNMYTDTLPKLEKILAQSGEPTKLASGVIYYSLQPHKLIILEDLSVSGYKIFFKRSLTEDETLMFYRKLAKFHAASFMLGQSEDHENIMKYDAGLFSNPAIGNIVLVQVGIHKFLDLLAQDAEFQIYREKVKAMQPEMLKMCESLFNAYKVNGRIQKDIFVLNHGDLHTRNLMFKLNSDDQIEDFVMVDYQISCFAPVNVDLIFSQYMVMQPKFRLRRNEFMENYFHEFIRVLRKINYQGDVPSYMDLQNSNLKYKHFSLFILSTFLPFTYVLESATVEELKVIIEMKLSEDPDAINALYNHSDYIEELRQLLPSLLKDGYFD